MRIFILSTDLEPSSEFQKHTENLSPPVYLNIIFCSNRTYSNIVTHRNNIWITYKYCTYRPIFPKQKSYLYIASVIFNATWSNNKFSNFLQHLLYAWSKLGSGTHIYLLGLVISAFSWVLWSYKQCCTKADNWKHYLNPCHYKVGNLILPVTFTKGIIGCNIFNT